MLYRRRLAIFSLPSLYLPISLVFRQSLSTRQNMNTVRQRLTATKTAFSSWEGFKKGEHLSRSRSASSLIAPMGMVQGCSSEWRSPRTALNCSLIILVLAAALVEPSEGYAADGKAFSWSNAHMDPTPIPERTWKWWNFASIWMAYG